MAALALPRDERVGLVLAVALHAAVLATLLFTRRDVATVPPPERVSVTISDEVAPTSTAPRPAPRAAPDVAPVLGEPAPPAPAPPAPAPPVPKPPEPAPPEPAPPLPARVAKPQPAPRPVPRAQPRPKPIAPAAPVAPRTPPQKVTRAPAPPRPATPARPTASARVTAPARPSAAPGKTAATTPPKRAGGSQIGADFLKGVANAPPTPARGQPATAIGPAQRASLSSAIARQLKPNWTAPQGADAELLVTVLTWDLDASGRLTGKPRVVSQQGITDANRAQAARHAEQAIRAVQLAAPFDLPAQYYAAWRHVAAFRFDRKLSQ